MKICECGNKIPSTKTIDGKKRNLRNRTQCLTCLPFGQPRYRKKNKKELLNYNAEKQRRHYYKKKKELGIDPVRVVRERRKQELVDLLGGQCQLCGYNKAIRNLVFHHLKDKKFPLSSRGFQYSMDKILPEVLKCIMVCHNCHGEIHDGLINDNLIIKLNKKVYTLIRKREG